MIVQRYIKVEFDKLIYRNLKGGRHTETIATATRNIKPNVNKY